MANLDDDFGLDEFVERRQSDEFVAQVKAGEMFILKPDTFHPNVLTLNTTPLIPQDNLWVQADGRFPLMFLGETVVDPRRNRYLKFLFTTVRGHQNVGWLEDFRLKHLKRHTRHA